MTVFNTQMHLVTFLITMFECMMLFFAFVWYVLRREDRSRLRYMVLLLLLIQYNVFSGLFPDPNLGIPVQIQTILAYFGGISVSMYFVYYIYKTFEVNTLRFYAIQGSIWFLFLPFVVLFIVPYMLTGDADLSRKLIVIMPFVFCILYVYVLSKALWKRYKATQKKIEKDEIVSVYVSVLLWATLPIIVYFDGSQLIENSITNTGFMIMSILFVKSAIIKSQEDHQTILNSQQELKDLNRTLQDKVEVRTRQLQKANEQRMNVFVNMVHETKTPLTLINNYLEEIVEKYGSSDEMDITKMNLAKLNRNMNNFFDIHKLERGLEIYDHSLVTNFSSILTNIVSVFTKWASQKSITINQNIEDDICVKADPEALDCIASNLIENAIKYIPHGSTINVELEIRADQAHLIVADNGTGISEKHQQKVFLPYYQVNHKKKNAQGIGMGLALVKKTVESLNVDIELISNKSGGTRIEIVFPVAEVVNNIEQEEFTVDQSYQHMSSEIEFKELTFDPTKQSILVVEDNLQLLTYIQTKLANNYNIFLATSGAKAIRRLKQLENIPDLILTDIMMDDMDGFAFVEILRAQSTLRHVPVIFLSAIAEHEQRIKGLKLGAVDYISKPFKIAELQAKIKSILSNLSNQRIAFMNGATKMMNGSQVSFQEKVISLDDKCKELGLTIRQAEIAQLLIDANSYKKIADQLHISEKTVSRHATDIFNKLEIKSKYELMNLFDRARKQA